MRFEVCPSSELTPGSLRTVEVGRISIVVMRRPDGRLRALRNRCAHQGAPLAAGWIETLVMGSEPGVYVLVEGKEVLRCPWHGYEYDIDTGCTLFDPEHVRVKAYPATDENGFVVVEY
jgi:nitrite reductase (NADH) small subunit